MSSVLVTWRTGLRLATSRAQYLYAWSCSRGSRQSRGRDLRNLANLCRRGRRSTKSGATESEHYIGHSIMLTTCLVSFLNNYIIVILSSIFILIGILNSIKTHCVVSFAQLKFLPSTMEKLETGSYKCFEAEILMLHKDPISAPTFPPVKKKNCRKFHTRV